MRLKLRSQGQDVLPFASCALWTMVILAVTPGIGRAADDQWQVGTTPSFSTGKYGTDTRTEIVHTPIIARRLFDDGDLTLVVPFLCIKGTGDVTVVSGSPVRTERSDSSKSSSSGPTERSGSSDRGGRTGTEPRGTNEVNLAPPTSTLAPITNCGVGDLVVRGRYYLIDERGWVPTIAIRAHVKTPTASAAQGLGTGRPDEGIGLEVSRMLGRGVLAMVDGGYTFIGRPAGVDFRNNWWYDVGIGQDLARGVVNLSVFFEEYSAILPGLDNAREILAAVSLKSAGGWRVQLSGQVGLSDGAPDHGITFGASRRF